MSAPVNIFVRKALWILSVLAGALIGCQSRPQSSSLKDEPSSKLIEEFIGPEGLAQVKSYQAKIRAKHPGVKKISLDVVFSDPESTFAVADAFLALDFNPVPLTIDHLVLAGKSRKQNHKFSSQSSYEVAFESHLAIYIRSGILAEPGAVQKMTEYAVNWTNEQRRILQHFTSTDRFKQVHIMVEATQDRPDDFSIEALRAWEQILMDTAQRALTRQSIPVVAIRNYPLDHFERLYTKGRYSGQTYFVSGNVIVLDGREPLPSERLVSLIGSVAAED